MVNQQIPSRLDVIDSHTGGEPTRCVLCGLPDLGSGPLPERLERLRQEGDLYRRAILCEPRGSDVLVGALLVDPVDPACAAGVIFFNNTGYLGMCGHGMMGVAVTLAHLGRIGQGQHRIETPVGVVTVELRSNGQVSIRNVPAYRYRAEVELEVPFYGVVKGDVAWGGNWFFLAGDHSFALSLAHVDTLTEFAWAIRQSLAQAGITGAGGAEIDHIELIAEPHHSANHSRNFVLCPGRAYDRSPCGTGTSAKMACLAADGKLMPGQIWRQEGILGTVFEGSFEVDKSETPITTIAGGPSKSLKIIPNVTGSAFVTAENTLIFDPHDPFLLGIPE